MTKICVLGLGYIGLPTALLFANNGNEVIGVDVNEVIVSHLNEGKMTLDESGMQELLNHAIGKGSFKAQTHVEDADVFLIAVPTPLDIETKLSDLKYVISACEMIKPYLKKDILVIIESTIPPGTCEKKIKIILEKSGLKVSNDFFISHCPERAIPGNTIYEMVNNDRIIGGIDDKSTEMAKSLYSCFVKGQMHLTNSRTAEMVKLMENTYRDINIALANELAQIADDYGVDVWEAIRIANKHPRVDILNPGPGVGGHCIAVDPWFLTGETTKSRIIQLSREINDSMPNYVIQLVKKILAGMVNPTLTILGVAYKGNVADTRATPARKFIKLAENEGYNIKIYDPYVEKFEYQISGLEDALMDSDCAIILTDHTEFKDIDPAKVSTLMRHKNLIDTKNIVKILNWKDQGFHVKILGDGKFS